MIVSSKHVLHQIIECSWLRSYVKQNAEIGKLQLGSHIGSLFNSIVASEIIPFYLEKGQSSLHTYIYKGSGGKRGP